MTHVDPPLAQLEDCPRLEQVRLKSHMPSYDTLAVLQSDRQGFGAALEYQGPSHYISILPFMVELSSLHSS